MEITKLASPFSDVSYIVPEVIDLIVFSNNIGTINYFSQTNKENYERYNADKTLLEWNSICSSLSPKQYALRMIKSAQMNDSAMATRLISTESKENEKNRQEVLNFFKYPTNRNPIECCMNAYKGTFAQPRALKFQKLLPQHKILWFHYLLLSTFEKNPINLLVLIKNNTPVNTKNHYGQTPLTAATTLQKKEIVKILLTYNCNKNDQDMIGYTALHYACKAIETQEIAQLLIDNGSELNIQSERGDTPLHMATRTNKLELAKKLIIKGANTEIKNNRGKSPLELIKNKTKREELRKCIPTKKRKRTDTIVPIEEPACKKSKKTTR
jgi:hypothetical protein